MVTRKKTKSAARIALFAAMLASTGCQNSPTRFPYSEVPTSVEVTPLEVTLGEIGATAQLTASVRNNVGDEIEDASVIWTTTDDSVVHVNEDGLVEAVGEGNAAVVAQSGEASGEAAVEVQIDEGG